MFNAQAGTRELSEMIMQALEVVAQYHGELRNLPVMPITSVTTVRDLLSEPLPAEPASLTEALAMVRDIVYPLSRHNGHPRFFGYVASPGSARGSWAIYLHQA